MKPDYIHAGSDLDVLIIGMKLTFNSSTEEDFLHNYVIILEPFYAGGYYGSGRRGGEVRIILDFVVVFSSYSVIKLSACVTCLKVAQFLVGLAERPAPNTHPRRFVFL